MGIHLPTEEDKKRLLEHAVGILTEFFIEDEPMDEDRVHMAKTLYMHITGKPWWTFHPTTEKEARSQLSAEEIKEIEEIALDIQKNATVGRIELPPDVGVLAQQGSPPPIPPHKLGDRKVHWPSFFRGMSKACSEAIMTGHRAGTKLVGIPECYLFKIMSTMSASIGYEYCTGDPWWMCSHETLDMAKRMLSEEREQEDKERAMSVYRKYLEDIGITIQQLADQLRPIKENEIDPWSPDAKESPFSPHWDTSSETSPFTRH